MNEQQRIVRTPPKPDMTITRDRNHPGTVSWLDCCRSMRRDMTNDEFEEAIPAFIDEGMRMIAAHQARSLQ